MIGWTYWLSAISVPAIEAEAVVTYLGGRYSSIGLMLLFFVRNYFGIRLIGEWN